MYEWGVSIGIKSNSGGGGGGGSVWLIRGAAYKRQARARPPQLIDIELVKQKRCSRSEPTLTDTDGEYTECWQIWKIKKKLKFLIYRKIIIIFYYLKFYLKKHTVCDISIHHNCRWGCWSCSKKGTKLRTWTVNELSLSIHTGPQQPVASDPTDVLRPSSVCASLNKASWNWETFLESEKSEIKPKYDSEECASKKYNMHTLKLQTLIPKDK